MKIEPTVCCLTEKAVVTTKTNLTGILAVLFLTNQACLDDLLKVDVWAFGMTLFYLLNPDLEDPFKLGH